MQSIGMAHFQEEKGNWRILNQPNCISFVYFFFSLLLFSFLFSILYAMCTNTNHHMHHRLGILQNHSVSISSISLDLQIKLKCDQKPFTCRYFVAGFEFLFSFKFNDSFIFDCMAQAHQSKVLYIYVVHTYTQSTKKKKQCWCKCWAGYCTI